MPTAAPKGCVHPGCGVLVRDGSNRCEVHRLKQQSEYDSRRGSSTQRGYNSRWQKARRTFLLHHPLCCMCEAEGVVEPATVVDHKKPHRGDQKLFWDTRNWQGLCKRHHDSTKQAEERSQGQGG